MKNMKNLKMFDAFVEANEGVDSTLLPTDNYILKNLMNEIKTLIEQGGELTCSFDVPTSIKDIDNKVFVTYNDFNKYVTVSVCTTDRTVLENIIKHYNGKYKFTDIIAKGDMLTIQISEV